MNFQPEIASEMAVVWKAKGLIYNYVALFISMSLENQFIKNKKLKN